MMYPHYDETELERLYKRLSLQQGSAFFCVIADPSLDHRELANQLCKRFLSGEAEVVEFKGIGNDWLYSSRALRPMFKEGARVVFLANFHLASRNMEDVAFFQALNQSRDALADWPVVLVFMMPLYFRKQIARKAPDFNSFFRFKAEFAGSGQKSTAQKYDAINIYSESNRELLDYYREKYDQLTDYDSVQAFDILYKILRLNSNVRILAAVENNRFFVEFSRLLPLYQELSDNSAHGIAMIYHSRGDYSEAMEWLEKALSISESMHGKEHPNTTNIYNNIGIVYGDKGDYNKALEWCYKALSISENVHNKEHPNTAAIYHNIGRVYEGQGEYDKALEWYYKALSISENVHGKEHPNTADTYNNIGRVNASQGDYDKALERYNKALAIYENVHGNNHPNTAAIYHNIGEVYEDQGDYNKALEWYNKALAIFENVLGKDHPNTAGTNKKIQNLKNQQSAP